MSQDTSQVAATDTGAGGQQENADAPFYKKFGDFTDEGAFASHVESLTERAAKAEELETSKAALEAQIAEIAPKTYKTDYAKRLDEFVQAELNNGSDEQTAYLNATEWIKGQMTPWEKIAENRPLDVLLALEKKKYPKLTDSDLLDSIKSKYGLDIQKPDDDDEAGMASYKRLVNIANVKASKDAYDAARELESGKIALGAHPSLKQQQEYQRNQAEAEKAVRPEYEKAVLSSSSFTYEVEGLKIDARLSPEEVVIMRSSNPAAYLDENGRVSAEKVGNAARNLYLIRNQDRIFKQLVEHAKSTALTDVVDHERNINEPAKGRPGGSGGSKTEAQELAEIALRNKR